MRVNCENCNTSFNLDESLVKIAGSKVRCSKCKHIFVVYPPKAEEDEQIVEAPVADLDADEIKSAAQEGEDLDLSDIEKMLETEEAPEATEDESEEDLLQEDVGGNGDGDLDLSDIEKILDEEDDSDELLEEKADDDEDLVFDLDENLEAEAGEEQISPTTELDLGDLEKMFESDEEPEPEMDEELETPDDEDLSTTFGLESGEEDLSLMPEAEKGDIGEELSLEAEEGAAVAEPEESGEVFGFDVESAEETEEAEEAPEVTDEEEAPSLDLEIKDEDIALDEASEVSVEDDQDLDLEAAIEIDTTEEEGTLEEPAAEAEELDLEATISIDSEALESEAEELDISMEDVSEISDTDEAALDAELPSIDELEIELESGEDEVEDVTSGDEASEDELTDFGEDEELEYPDDLVPDIPDEDEAFDEDVPGLEEDQEAEEDFEEVAVEASGGGLKKFFIFLAVLLFIIVLLVALLFLNYKGIVTVPYLDKIEIPFLAKEKTPQVVDLGNLNISYDVDNYRFLETEKAGKLFLITGKVKNEYSMPRSFIQMSGSLYTKDKVKSGSATAYCGNVIADLELKQMTPAAIRTRLGNRSGENDSNVNIKPGEERPFMIVFFDLPESLDEFTVAVLGSSVGR